MWETTELPERDDTMAERMARVEVWQSSHERRCEDRYSGIQTSMNEVKEVIGGWKKAMWAGAVALIVWGAAQIYSDLKNPGHVPVAAAIAESVSR